VPARLSGPRPEHEYDGGSRALPEILAKRRSRRRRQSKCRDCSPAARLMRSGGTPEPPAMPHSALAGPLLGSSSAANAREEQHPTGRLLDQAGSMDVRFSSLTGRGRDRCRNGFRLCTCRAALLASPAENRCRCSWRVGAERTAHARPAWSALASTVIGCGASRFGYRGAPSATASTDAEHCRTVL
jgi:hypothetical protein